MGDTRGFETRRPAAAYDVLAPDASEIRLLVSVRGGSAAHCTLPAGRTSLAVRHRTVEEVWYFLRGRGRPGDGSLEDRAAGVVAGGVRARTLW